MKSKRLTVNLRWRRCVRIGSSECGDGFWLSPVSISSVSRSCCRSSFGNPVITGWWFALALRDCSRNAGRGECIRRGFWFRLEIWPATLATGGCLETGLSLSSLSRSKMPSLTCRTVGKSFSKSFLEFSVLLMDKPCLLSKISQSRTELAKIRDFQLETRRTDCFYTFFSTLSDLHNFGSIFFAFASKKCKNFCFRARRWPNQKVFVTFVKVAEGRAKKNGISCQSRAKFF